VSTVHDVYADLITEGEELDQLVTGLGLSHWQLPTPAPGWQITHQIAHLASTARLARASVTDPGAFQAVTAGAADDFDAVLDRLLRPYLPQLPSTLLARWRAERAGPSDALAPLDPGQLVLSYLPQFPSALLAQWRAERARASEALATLDPGQMVPWVAGRIPADMLASAGLMELFAHGQDIADAVGVRLERNDRIRHLVTLAVRNRDFGYFARGLVPPDEPFRFELKAPSGELWEYGPASANEQVSGPAVDFCLLVTRRRNRADLAVTASGPVTDQWLNIAQCYLGGPGRGRAPGQFGTARFETGQFASSVASPA
jgi:hypothetical protein